ncbi:MAG: LptF/LptG family permease [Pirellulales bacterium]
MSFANRLSVRIIDRYMLRQFIQVYVICFCSLAGLYIVFDAFSNLDEFLHCAEQRGNLFRVMGEYYAFRSIFFFDRTSGILTLIAAMFTVTWIQRHHELTALLMAGISKARVIAPVIAGAMLISLLAAANRELVIPRIQDQLSQKPKDMLGDVPQDLRPRYDNETDVQIGGKQTFANRQRIHKPNFALPPALEAYGSQLTAKEAYYQPPLGNRPAGYLLDGVLEPKDLDKRASLSLSGRPVVITPRDRPDWLKPGQCFVASNIDFEQLTGGQGWRQFSSTADLVAGLKNPSLDFGADVRVAIHGRVVQPLLDMTLLFLGLPLVLSRQNRNMFVAIGLCIGVVANFVSVIIGFQYLGNMNFLSPALAAWFPLVIFVPVAAGLSDPFLE